MASDGGTLPSAREVSVAVHRPVYQDDTRFTVMLAVWGQFIDHDITATALSTGGKILLDQNKQRNMKVAVNCDVTQLYSSRTEHECSRRI